MLGQARARRNNGRGAQSASILLDARRQTNKWPTGQLADPAEVEAEAVELADAAKRWGEIDCALIEIGKASAYLTAASKIAALPNCSYLLMLISNGSPAAAAAAMAAAQPGRPFVRRGSFREANLIR